MSLITDSQTFVLLYFGLVLVRVKHRDRWHQQRRWFHISEGNKLMDEVNPMCQTAASEDFKKLFLKLSKSWPRDAAWGITIHRASYNERSAAALRFVSVESRPFSTVAEPQGLSVLTLSHHA